MTTELQFDKQRTRVECCPCGKSNRDGKFAPFVGYTDKGHCHSCGETFPVEFEKTIGSERPIYGNKTSVPERIPSSISPDLLAVSLQRRARNVFVEWLVGLFGETKTQELIEMYRIGTSTHWNKAGACIFWQIDAAGIIRSGKIMLYSADGHRVREPFDHCTWLHSVLKMEDFNLSQCFFGLHLIDSPENIHKTIGIVESEKTAIIASMYFPYMVWIASGGANGLTKNKIAALKGRNVLLCPDLGKFDQWSKEAEKMKDICTSVRVWDFLERNATDEDKKSGFDIADYFVHNKVQMKDISSKEVNCCKAPTEHKRNEERYQSLLSFSENDYEPQRTETLTEIDEIETQLQSVVLPKGTVRINQCTTTNDIALCIEKALHHARITAGKPHIGHIAMLHLRMIKDVLILPGSPNVSVESTGGAA